MTMSEYEERFRPPAPSLHQTFVEVRGANRGGRRSRRLWVAAALFGVATITSKAALHHSTHANGLQVWKSGIRSLPIATPTANNISTGADSFIALSSSPKSPAA